jgi:hypothetical protein
MALDEFRRQSARCLKGHHQTRRRADPAAVMMAGATSRWAAQWIHKMSARLALFWPNSDTHGSTVSSKICQRQAPSTLQYLAYYNTFVTMEIPPGKPGYRVLWLI